MGMATATEHSDTHTAYASTQRTENGPDAATQAAKAALQAVTHAPYAKGPASVQRG